MAINWEEFESDIREEYNGTTFVIERLDHEINVLLERRQAIMAKDVNPLVIQMDEILNSLDPHDFGGEYLYKSEWYKNLDLESWGIYKHTDNGNKEGIDDDTILVDDLDGIEKGSELLIEIETGEKVQRTVSKVEYSDYYEGYLIYLDEDESTWDRKYMPDALYPRCIDPIDEKACVAYNPCSDEFYKLPEWDDNLPEYVESDTIPLEVKYGVAPYTWTLIAGEIDGWSLESEITNDGYNTLYSNDTCDLPAIVQVTDYCGNKTEEYMVINTSTVEKIILYAPETVIPGDEVTLIIAEGVNGGTPPYTWIIEEQPYNENCSSNKCEYLLTDYTTGKNNILYTNEKSCGTVSIKVTDKCGVVVKKDINFNNTVKRRVYKFGYSGQYWNSYSHHEYPPGWDCNGRDWRGCLIDIRMVLNGYFVPSFLKTPFLNEISKKLWDYPFLPDSPIPFPEYGLLDGEEGGRTYKTYNNKTEFWEALKPLNYDYTPAGYRNYMDHGRFYIAQNSPCCAIFCYERYYYENKPSCLNNTYCWYDWWESHQSCQQPKVRLTAALMCMSQGRGWHDYHNNVSGELIGKWPFYCSVTWDPDSYDGRWYIDDGRWLGNIEIYVKVCSNDQGRWRLDENGEYYLEDKWIRV